MNSQKEVSERLCRLFSENQIGRVGKQIWKSDLVDIEFTSPKTRLKVIVSSQDSEVSLFFEDPNSISDWHTHMSLFGANEIQEQIEKSLELIQELIFGNLKIVESSKRGFWISDDMENETKFADKDERISLVKWHDL